MHAYSHWLLSLREQGKVVKLILLRKDQIDNLLIHERHRLDLFALGTLLRQEW